MSHLRQGNGDDYLVRLQPALAADPREDLSSLGSVPLPRGDGNGRLREARGEPGGAGVVGCGASGHAREARGQYFRGAGHVLSRRSHTFPPTRSARPDSRYRGTWRCTSSARAIVGRVHGSRKEEGVCAQLGVGPLAGWQRQGQSANAGAADRAGCGQRRSECDFASTPIDSSHGAPTGPRRGFRQPRDAGDIERMAVAGRGAGETAGESARSVVASGNRGVVRFGLG